MAWFGGSLPQLSSITDQISSFTKEVLTETTEEVEGRFFSLLKSRLIQGKVFCSLISRLSFIGRMKGSLGTRLGIP